MVRHTNTWIFNISDNNWKECVRGPSDGDVHGEANVDRPVQATRVNAPAPTDDLHDNDLVLARNKETGIAGIWEVQNVSEIGEGQERSLWDDAEYDTIIYCDPIHRELESPYEENWDDFSARLDESIPTVTANIQGAIHNLKPEYKETYLNKLLEQVKLNQAAKTRLREELEEDLSTETPEEIEVTSYWDIPLRKQEKADKFVADPSRETFRELVDPEHFWGTRSRNADHYVDEVVFAEQTPAEVANTFSAAVETGSLQQAFDLDGFRWPTATEILQAIAPEQFAILNDRAASGLASLGYETPDPQSASEKQYKTFVDNVRVALERYNLENVGERVSDQKIPEWASGLQIADYVFYRFSEGEVNLEELDGVSPDAPYYWVNQGEKEIEQEYLQAPTDHLYQYDLPKLDYGDRVFSYNTGEIRGFHEVQERARIIEISSEEASSYSGDEDTLRRYRVETEFVPFEEPLVFADVFSTLLEFSLDQYYPVNPGGINQQYLFNLSEEAGAYLLEEADTTPDGPAPLSEQLTLSNVAIDLPDDLYFHGSEEEYLKRQINAALNSGKHIIFTGPPGTGKSKLAKHIAAEVQSLDEVDGYTFTTATAEWTTFDTIGGYVPATETDRLEFDPRLFLQCFRTNTGMIQNQWLVIDELNRANIDKALGPLFSVLSEDSVVLPYERDEQVRIDWVDEDTPTKERAAIVDSEDRYPVTPAWRIIGTMNTFDKTSLYELSFAFMRRFSYVHVGVPDLWNSSGVADHSLLDPGAGQNYASLWIDEFDGLRAAIETYHEPMTALWATINRYRSIGPSILLDMFKHIAAYEGGDRTGPMTSAVISLVFPQLEGMRAQEQKDLINALESAPTITTDGDSTKSIDLPVDVRYLKQKAEDMYEIDFDA